MATAIADSETPSRRTSFKITSEDTPDAAATSAAATSAPSPPHPHADDDNLLHPPPAMETSTTSSLSPTPAVRFSSAVEELVISPAVSSEEFEAASAVPNSNITTEDQLRQLTRSLEGAQLHDQRTRNFQFEPFSLPATRMCSREDDSQPSSRLSTLNSLTIQTPMTDTGSPAAIMATPPLTPSATDSASTKEKKLSFREDSGKALASEPSMMITPQTSSSREPPAPPASTAVPARTKLVHRPASDYGPFPLITDEETEQRARARKHRKGIFSIGPGSLPSSRDSSPSRVSASQLYSKPVTPGGKPDDPYAASKRTPQAPNPSRHSLDSRFVFASLKTPRGSSSSLSDKKSSTDKKSSDKSSEKKDSDSSRCVHNRHSSFADLKRMLKRSNGKKNRDADSPGRGSAPALSRKSSPLGMWVEDQPLTTRYGKLGKTLGSGSGGSVQLMKRLEDGTVFAVKEFRPKFNYESPRVYKKKVLAEFCIGSTLHHGNIIETLDVVQEKNQWFQIMEYAPYDLFAAVMTARMSKTEITCCFLQLLNGVTYLHSVGLAHRDLKLENVVISKDGILKIIDFGSAHVFKYPFESGTVRATGVVGSDPYMAPEVSFAKDYDARAADIWSLAIIYCCMNLRKFPWKIADETTDMSYKHFNTSPTPGHDPKKLLSPHRSWEVEATPDSLIVGTPVEKPKEGGTSAHAHGKRRPEDKAGDRQSAAAQSSAPPANDNKPTESGNGGEIKPQNVRGPWRVLRHLPRESRYIIWRMLEPSAKRRATMEEILEEVWVADTEICRQEEHGEVMHATDHTHVLEAPPDKEAVNKDKK